VNSGVRTLVLEKLPRLIDYPRGVGVDDEALRSFQAVKLVDAVRRHTVPNQIMRFVDRKGRVLATFVRDHVTRLSLTRDEKTLVLERKLDDDGTFSPWKLISPSAVEAGGSAREQNLAAVWRAVADLTHQGEGGGHGGDHVG